MSAHLCMICRRRYRSVPAEVPPVPKQGLRQDSEAATTNNGTNCTRTAIFPWCSVLTDKPSHRLANILKESPTIFRQHLIDLPDLSQLFNEPPFVTKTHPTHRHHRLTKPNPISHRLTLPLSTSKKITKPNIDSLNLTQTHLTIHRLPKLLKDSPALLQTHSTSCRLT